ncbi:tetratricopeptide repeat protein [Candidatus Poribacteria bacterium]
MRNHKGLVIERSYHTLRIALLLVICSLLAGCAVLGGTKPKPIPMGEVNFHIEEGNRYLSEGNYDKAVESYTAAINTHPESIDAHAKLGEAYVSHGEIDLALEEFARIIQIKPDYSHAYNYRGFLYHNQEKWTEAAKEFESSVKIDPENLYSLNYLGLVYKMMGRLDDAKDILRKAIELDPEMDTPDSKDTHNFLGLVYQDETKYEEAIAEFRKTLEHFPEDAVTHSYLGTALENSERFREAAEEYRNALQYDPGYAFATTRLEALAQAGISYIPPVEIVEDDPESYISAAPDSSEYPNAGAIVLLDKFSYEFTDAGVTRYTLHKIIKILNDRGIQEFGEIALPFNHKSQNVGVNVARTVLPDGTQVEASPDAIHDITPPGLADYNLYSDIRYKVVSMPALQPDAIIEYKITVEDAQATTEMAWILGGMIFQWTDPMLTAKCVLRVPKETNIKWKMYNGEIEPVITRDDDGRLTYIWISKNAPEFVPEAAMPPMDELVPFLVFSTAESWDDVHEWYRDLAEPQELSDKDIKRKVAELIVGKTTKEEKTKAIFGFVASKVRYVAIELGMGAYRPYPATDVFKNRYGDCKDKTTLLITMLREAGIDAYAALISPAPRRSVDTGLPSVGQFSHVIAAVKVEDVGYVLLDPTIATCRYGDLPAGDQGRKALIIGKDGSEFIDTPVSPPEANKIASESEITLLKDGTIHGWEQTTANGQADIYLRSVYRTVRPDGLKGFMESILNQRYPGVEIEDVSLSDLYNLDKPVEVKVDFSCPNYVADLEEMMVFPLPSEGFSSYSPLVGSPERKYDLILGYTTAMERVFTLTFPQGYALADLPADRTAEYEFGSFTRKYEEVSESVVRYSVSLRINIPAIPVADYADFKSLIDTAAREDRAQIILRKSGS